MLTYRIPVYFGSEIFLQILHFSALLQEIILQMCRHATPFSCPRGLFARGIFGHFRKDISPP